MLQGYPFTRVLVYEGTPDHITGFVNVYQALGPGTPFESLHAFVKPIQTVTAETFVTDVIDRMQQDRLKILLVVRSLRGGGHKTIGMVTMKDLAEELLGELAVW
jgi:CBS domain containing-hemolysin-like protein